MFNSDNGKESRKKQMAQQENKKRSNHKKAAKGREVKHAKHNLRDENTSPIPTPTNYYFRTMTESSMTFHQKTLVEFHQSNNERESIRNYNKYCNIKLLATGLFIISLSGYSYLRHFLPLPHERTVQRWVSNQTQNSTPIQFNVTNSFEIIEKYIEYNNLNKTSNFKVFLSVDAFAVKPTLIIDDNGIRRGTLNDTKVEDDRMKAMQESVIMFENYSLENKKIMISDTFVYLVQPLLAEYPCFILHLSASSQGKATLKEIELLFYLKDVLESYNFTVEGFGFDGDTTYSKLVKNWNSIVYKSFHSNNLTLHSKIESDLIKQFHPKVAVDPLHILKRWRYRIFKGNLQQLFEETNNLVDIQQWRYEFDIPSLVLLDKPYMKMNDDLPLKLFNPIIMKKLYDKNDKPTLSYFLVPSIFTMALKFKFISKKDTESLLELCLYYLFLYEDTLKTFKKPLTDKPYKNRKMVRMIPNNILCDTKASISTLLFLSKTDINSTIYFNRVGSNPVEHAIGGIRMLSKNENTYHKLKRVMGRKNLLNDIYHEIKVKQKISGRLPTLGKNLNNLPQKSLFNFDPKIMAFCLFKYLGFPINQSVIQNLITSTDISSVIDFQKCTEMFFQNFIDAINIEYENSSKNKYFSTSRYDHDETVRIQQRYYGTGQFFNQK